MSPVGVPNRPDHLKPENLFDINSSYLSKLGYNTLVGIWSPPFAPFDIFRVIGGNLAYYVIRFLLKSRMRNLDEDIITKVSLYVHQLMMKPKSSETAITAILGPFAFARYPLVNRIVNLKLKVTFLYG